MSYFLKQTKIKERVYLQISITTYNKETKKCSNKAYKKIGFVDEIIKQGINDPISYYKNEVNELNSSLKEEKKKNKELVISSNNKLYYGHFILETIINSLGINEIMEEFFISKNVPFRYFKIFKSLLYCRFVNSNFISNNYNDYYVKLFNQNAYDEEDITSTVNFLGQNYVEIISKFYKQIDIYKNAQNKITYFNCYANYLTIGSNSELINESIMLDELLIPNQLILSTTKDKSQKDIISQIQKTYKGNKVVRVFDKAINYGKEVYNARLNKYGYIFPISLSNLPEKDKEWILDSENYTEIKDADNKLMYKVKAWTVDQQIYVAQSNKNGFLITEKQKQIASFNEQLAEKKKKEIYKLVDTSKSLFYMNADKQDYGKSIKYIKFIKQNDDSTKLIVNEEKIKEELKYAGYKLIVTNDSTIKKKDIFEIADVYWKIDDYFKRIRSQLDSQKENKNIDFVYGHYLIGFIVVMFYRIIETTLFRNYTTIDIYNFIRSLKCLNIGMQNVNLLNQSPLVDVIQNTFKIHIDKQFFANEEINKLFSIKIK